MILVELRVLFTFWYFDCFRVYLRQHIASPSACGSHLKLYILTKTAHAKVETTVRLFDAHGILQNVLISSPHDRVPTILCC